MCSEMNKTIIFSFELMNEFYLLVIKFMEEFLCTRHCPEHFMIFALFNPSISPLWFKILTTAIIERRKLFSRVHIAVKVGGRVRTLVGVALQSTQS